ncbi:hypothetical protein Ddye_030249 [Dipteronia dyeriana]|uniref:Uncharacterized protein n=1 Tax=Dipteronia dyeriana TaxID=168575 RepID=A0AAD9TGN7_9ROSI|nr:hypothetical protein Ddye_030249 [Dipteronia dyeriana]
MESRNLERDGRILKFEEGGFGGRFWQRDYFTIGLAPSGSAGSSRQQSYSNPAHKVPLILRFIIQLRGMIDGSKGMAVNGSDRKRKVEFV